MCIRDRIITYSEQKAKEIYEDCRYFDRQAVLYQAKDFLFFHADMQGNLLVQQRVRALQALLTREEVTVITTFDGLMDRLRPLKKVEDSILCIGQDSIVQIDALAEKLSRLGYERDVYKRQEEGLGTGIGVGLEHAPDLLVGIVLRRMEGRPDLRRVVCIIVDNGEACLLYTSRCV